MSPALQPDWVAPHRTALLVIDIQVDFAAPDGAMARGGADIKAAQTAVECAGALAGAARTAGVMPVFTQTVRVRGQASAAERESRARQGKSDEPEICEEGARGAALVGPQPREGEVVITKRRYSVFAGTGLDEMLRARGIDTLVLCGLTTECCIQSSAWDAFERDFHVLIATDACAAYESDLHAAALASLEQSGAILATGADLRRAWKIP